MRTNSLVLSAGSLLCCRVCQSGAFTNALTSSSMNTFFSVLALSSVLALFLEDRSWSCYLNRALWVAAMVHGFDEPS